MKLDLKKDIEPYFYIRGNFDLIQCTDNLDFKSVFDVGCGKGGAALYFANKGKSVTTITLDEKHHSYREDLFNEFSIEVVKGDFASYKTDKKYDAVWMSHSLEHTQNPGIFLQNARNILNDDGWLFVLVPPYHSMVHSGHFSMGWNLGILMYNLLALGFDIKNGHFIKYGNNICAFVRKKRINKYSSEAYININDTLNEWPMNVRCGFIGDIDEVNWFEKFLPKFKLDKQKREKYGEDDKKINDFYMEHILNNKEKINDFINLNKDKKICFYGAGLFAQKIIEKHDFSGLNLIGFIDKNPCKISKKIGKYDTYSIKDIRNLNPDIIVITTYKKLNIIEDLSKLLYKLNLNIKIDSDLFS